MMPTCKIICGDALAELKKLPDDMVQCAVTSPPYWNMRDYSVAGQVGHEDTLDQYIDRLVSVFREVRRVLTSTGVLWLNIGDCYIGSGGPGGDFKNGKGGDIYGRQYCRSKRMPRGWNRWGGGNNTSPGLKRKDMAAVPWTLALAMRSDGWWLRQRVIWWKTNPAPDTAKDRPVNKVEEIFYFSKSANCYYDYKAVKTCYRQTTLKRNDNKKVVTPVAEKRPVGMIRRETSYGGALLGNVWRMPVAHSKDAHFATFPIQLPETCIRASSHPGDMILDPFVGSGTTGIAAMKLGRGFIGIELNPEYVEMSRRRINNECGLIAEVAE
jgi:DNA modification methylase